MTKAPHRTRHLDFFHSYYNYRENSISDYILKFCIFVEVDDLLTTGRKNFPLRVKCVGEGLISWLASVLRSRGGGMAKINQDRVISFSYELCKCSIDNECRLLIEIDSRGQN